MAEYVEVINRIAAPSMKVPPKRKGNGKLIMAIFDIKASPQ